MSTPATPYVTGPQRRGTYLVGSLPGAGPLEAMGSALWYLGDSLLALPGGETGTVILPDGTKVSRSNWVEAELRAVGQLPVITDLRPEAGYSGYDDTPHFAAPPGMTAAGFEPAMQLRPAFGEAWPVFRQLCEDRGSTGLLFQAGVPAPLDLGLYAFKEAGLDPQLQDAISQAKAIQVLACHAEARDRVMFQLESPAAVAMAAAGQAKFAASQLAGLPGLCPGTSWSVHLCFGDWFHQAMTHLDSAAPLAELAAELAGQWPYRTGWKVLHLPMAAAGDPPSLDPAWYAPLAGLRELLPGGCQLAAGFVHARRSLDELKRLQDVIEDAWGAEVMVAAACGLGRYPDPDEPAGILMKTAVLAGPR